MSCNGTWFWLNFDNFGAIFQSYLSRDTQFNISFRSDWHLRHTPSIILSIRMSRDIGWYSLDRERWCTTAGWGHRLVIPACIEVATSFHKQITLCWHENLWCLHCHHKSDVSFQWFLSVAMSILFSNLPSGATSASHKKWYLIVNVDITGVNAEFWKCGAKLLRNILSTENFNF